LSGADVDTLRAGTPFEHARTRAELVAALDAVQQAAVDDFAADRTVLVGGWLLAEVEARAAGTYAVLSR
jgi:hypothetical protein